jgi:hypothetical protein
MTRRQVYFCLGLAYFGHSNSVVAAPKGDPQLGGIFGKKKKESEQTKEQQQEAREKQLAKEERSLPKEERVRLAFRELLSIGAKDAITTASLAGAFANNPELKIGLPLSVQRIEAKLRENDLGADLDGIVVEMNRVAELAAPLLQANLLPAINEMTVVDERPLLKGIDVTSLDEKIIDAAVVKHFQRQLAGKIAGQFRPEVAKLVAETPLGERWAQLVKQASRIPFTRVEKMSMDSYLTDRVMDGVFLLMGKTEALVRRDPAARTTANLKLAFGK